MGISGLLFFRKEKYIYEIQFLLNLTSYFLPPVNYFTSSNFSHLLLAQVCYIKNYLVYPVSFYSCMSIETNGPAPCMCLALLEASSVFPDTNFLPDVTLLKFIFCASFLYGFLQQDTWFESNYT